MKETSPEKFLGRGRIYGQCDLGSSAFTFQFIRLSVKEYDIIHPIHTS
jgi:hypothetical protein